MEKLKMHTPDLAEENYKKLVALFPDAVTETITGYDEKGKPIIERAIDKDVLMQEINAQVVGDGQERYQFTWPDKRKSVVLANAPIAKTLRFEREKSVGRDGTSGGTDSENIYIEGDNLDALKLLQETYLGKVRMIYIDPPYNTGRDFIYSDNYTLQCDDYIRNSGQKDEGGNQLVQNAETNGRFHTDWLNMMYPRLRLARDLLSDQGVIFISIDDNEVDEIKKICTEIFGEQNFVGCAGRITKKSNNKGDFWAPNFDYIITYVKNRDTAVEFTGGANIDSYNLVEEDGPRKGEKYQLVRLYMSSIQNRNPEQRFWISCPDGSKIIPPGTTFPPERPNLGDGIWRWSKATFEANKDKIVVKRVKSSNLLNQDKEPAQWNVFTKTYLKDVLEKSSAKPNSFIEEYINQMASHELNELNIPFDYAKPTELIKYLMKVAQVEDGDVVMDFFSGSASTAHAAFKYNSEEGKHCSFVMVQLPETIDENNKAFKAGYHTICDIGEERIRRAGKKIKEETGADIDYGFRCFKVDSSNMKDVFYRPADIGQMNLDQFTDNIKEDRTPDDLLIQVMLDLGVLLSSKVEQTEIAGKKVFSVADGYLIACFDQDVTDEVVTAIAKQKPFYAVFRDSSMANDSVATNFEQIFATYSPQTVRKVL